MCLIAINVTAIKEILQSHCQKIKGQSVN